MKTTTEPQADLVSEMCSDMYSLIINEAESDVLYALDQLECDIYEIIERQRKKTGNDNVCWNDLKFRTLTMRIPVGVYLRHVLKERGLLGEMVPTELVKQNQ